MPTLTVHRETPARIDPAWSFGIGTCHAPLWFTPELQRHLQEAQSACGFRYVRAVGLIGDTMLARDPSGYGFAGVCDALQVVLDLGYKPFVNLSHMPLLLARGDDAIGGYKFRSSPPESFEKWEQFVDSLATALVTRFGIEELRTWYFEVWHRPDTSFWAGSREEYFRLYDHTVRSLKRADQQLRIGGPAASDPDWLAAFLEHLTTTKTPCDFVGVHLPVDEVASRVNAVRQLRDDLAGTLGSHVELFAAVEAPSDPSGDTCAHAALRVSALTELAELCRGVFGADASDIAEAHGFPHLPFHGGGGLINVNGVPKASFYALAMLKQLTHGTSVACTIDEPPTGVGALASLADDETRVLLYHTGDTRTGVSEPVKLRLRGLPGATASVHSVTPGAGSAFEAWRDLGKPAFATRELLEQLEDASRPGTASVWTATEQLTLEPGTVALLTSKAS